MRVKTFSLIFGLISSVSLFGMASGSSVEMLPTPSERLKNPIELSNCGGATIIEWRPTPGRVMSTSPSPRAIGLLNATCKLVFDNYLAFIASEAQHTGKIISGTSSKINVEVCMMPADVGDHGLDFRNLNDIYSRFKNRRVSGMRYFWGYLDVSLNTIFMENEAADDYGRLNSEFASTFAHELYHSISAYSGVYYNVGSEEEEDMAQRFTRYLGFKDQD